MADDITEHGSAVVEDVPATAAPKVGKASKRYLAAKRLVDVCLAALLLFVLSPVMLVVAVLIAFDSPGPVFFRQQRVGRWGKLFTIYKFRSMTTRAPTYSYKVPSYDARVTRVGRLLRRSGLDELPQMLNVLRGDMSLIGPRPELPFIVEQFQLWNHPRHTMSPGITGWWQIHHRNEVPLHLNLQFDTYYIQNACARLDWVIAYRTVVVMVKGAFTPGSAEAPLESVKPKSR